VIERVRTQDEAVGVKTDITKGQSIANAHGIEIGLGRLIQSQRIVMAVEHGNGVRDKDRHHGRRLRGSDAHSEKTLPVTANNSAARTELVQNSCGKLNHFDCGLRCDTGRMRSRGLRNKRNGVCSVITRVGHSGRPARELGWKEVFDAEHLRGQDTINRGEAELTFAMKEVGNM
jgi:hypothetical protein